MIADWNDTKDIMLEVEQLFCRDDDVMDLQDIHKMNTEIDSHYNNILKVSKDLIKGMFTS